MSINNIDQEEIEKISLQYLHQQNINASLLEATKKDSYRIDLDLNKMRESHPKLAESIIKYPLKLIPIIEKQVNSIYNELRGEKVANREKTIFEKKSRNNSYKYNRYTWRKPNISKRAKC